jgi:hypothetical protein
VAFEKASVLFNIGGLYTQIGKILHHPEAVLWIRIVLMPIRIRIRFSIFDARSGSYLK